MIGGGGEAIEYALRMRRFDQEDLLDRMARRGALAPAHMEKRHACHKIDRGHVEMHFATGRQKFGQIVFELPDIGDIAPGSRHAVAANIHRPGFNAVLREVDPVDEIADLATECARLGAGWISGRMLLGASEAAT